MTFFYPLRNKTAFDIFDKAYKAAMQEAKQVGERQKLKMRVEILRPIHLGLAEYKHGTGIKNYILRPKFDTLNFLFSIIPSAFVMKINLTV